MRYAITYENNFVFQHFGKCPTFLITNLENGTIQNKQLLSAQGSVHGALVDLLFQHKIDILVCGGIGEGARTALHHAGIQLIAGASGNVDVILEQLQKGILVDNPRGVCHHHDAEHNCGNHKC